MAMNIFLCKCLMRSSSSWGLWNKPAKTLDCLITPRHLGSLENVAKCSRHHSGSSQQSIGTSPAGKSMCYPYVGPKYIPAHCCRHSRLFNQGLCANQCLCAASFSTSVLSRDQAPKSASNDVTSDSGLDAAAAKVKARAIQKDISPLTTKRIVRRKKTKDSAARDKEVFDVMAFSTSEEYNLETLKSDLEHQGLYGLVSLPKDAVDALHVEAKYRVGDEPREIFFFSNGAVVFWNMPEVEREAVIKFLGSHQTGSYDINLAKVEFEPVEFTYTDKPTELHGDEIQLQKPQEQQQQQSPAQNNQMEKYAFSNAMALSVKLGLWEASLEKYVDSIEWILQDLKTGRKIKISQSDILQKTGELLNLRHLINLSSDLLDVPDFYWDRENLESLYVKTCNNFNIARRTKVINEKLTHCTELSELVRDHLKDRHHTRLEWMIIWLIMIEVGFEMVRMAERKLEKFRKGDSGVKHEASSG